MPGKRDVTVKALSSNLLQMKFMKRSVLEDDKEEEQKVYKESAEHWVVDEQFLKRHQTLDMRPSYAMCEDLPYTRMSFKGFNPAIEKIMRSLNGEESEEETIPEEDKKFADEYASVSNVAKKFSTKRQRADNSRPHTDLHGVSKKPDRFKPKFKGCR